jgi:hydrogenase maturation protease
MTAEPQHQILVIGIGNEFRGDDGVGHFIARSLMERAPAVLSIQLQSGDGAALMESLRQCRAVYLIDAMQTGAAPGTIRRIDAQQEALPANFFSTSTHHFGIAMAVELARALNQLPESLIIYGIEGRQYDLSTGLSAEVRMAADELLEQLMKEISTETEQWTFEQREPHCWLAF